MMNVPKSPLAATTGYSIRYLDFQKSLCLPPFIPVLGIILAIVCLVSIFIPVTSFRLFPFSSLIVRVYFFLFLFLNLYWCSCSSPSLFFLCLSSVSFCLCLSLTIRFLFFNCFVLFGHGYSPCYNKNIILFYNYIYVQL